MPRSALAFLLVPVAFSAPTFTKDVAAIFHKHCVSCHRPGEVAPMIPGAPTELVIDLWDTAITFEKGHRIALHVSSSSSPRFAVNPNTGEAEGAAKLKPRVAVNSVYHDAAHPSALVLPVIYAAP